MTQQTLISETKSRHPVLGFVYDVVLGVASGFAVGFFAWIAADRLIHSPQPLWPWSLGGIVVLFFFLRWARAQQAMRGWVHLLWIPVALLIGLMTLIILALRSFT